jgi:calcium-dependent protein kinase
LYIGIHPVPYNFYSDLKPENIVFEGESVDSTLKIIDFGRSKIVKRNEVMTEKAGSLYYVAPEIAAGKGYNEKCDIWSCGVVLYLMIAGHPPFYGSSRDDVVIMIKKGLVEYKGITLI